MQRWRIYRWYAGIGDDPRLAVAQAMALHRQVPLLYILLLINSCAVVMTHHDQAPALISIVVPAVLFAICIWRLLHWRRIGRSRHAPEPAVARQQLRHITLLGGVIASTYIAWATVLLTYGDMEHQSHVIIYITTTVIGCIFCIFVLPQAAVLIGSIVITALLMTCILHKQTTYSVIGINIAMVVTVLVMVLLNSFDQFRKQVRAQSRLKRQHGELIRLNEENDRLARTDSLTGVPNRRHFQADLEEMVAAAAPFAIGLLDLDRFKPVNDSYGHHIGDMLLTQLARRARELIGGDASFYRLGGDEFGLLIPGDAVAAASMGARLVKGLGPPFAIGELKIAVGGSIGLALFPESGDTGATLFDRADYALYHAKRVNGGGMCIFTPDLEKAIRRDRTIEAAMQASVFADQLQIVGQPIVNATSGKVEAVEMLARWQHPLLGMVPPSDFIAIAERSTLIHGITLAVFRKGLAAAMLLPDTIALSFNISAYDLTSPGTLAGIEYEIAAAGIAPARIWIEVTETAVMRDAATAARVLERFRAAGMRIALDDFGTGYSSLSNLHQLPLDKVKIDRSFLDDVQAERGWAVVKSVIGLCRALDLACVAEGVETRAQLDALVRIGCEHMQGYLFARPQPIEQLSTTIADIKPRHAA